MTPRGRTGPRADRTDARGDILSSARELFSARGFRGTTMRAVAEGAGVDVALVPYYFGNKEGLFAATLELPVDPRAKLDAAFAEGVDGAGVRIARAVVGVFDDETVGPTMIGLVRSAMTDGTAHEAVRDFLVNVIVEGYAIHLDGPDARERAALAAAQIIGLAVARYVLRIEPLASMSVDEVVAYVGPALQRCLDGP
ncbi:TetR family transcriptional regulator [Intrasporangium oryzae NRRL B-24470]|uniref:TetR family transcriptional regulator n=1 Tax=Intrasporangium oryzae NRRL B-24470 TaxID=1386089 RepID=W9G796_9MICO|nr:TetR family transcriptional regulator [Intrasporangium oryzae]EWS99753.1 TetR family transcriptional regulator [Intrasporangium oryzae NRRL B-24470]